jgi:hypothetical protein
MNGPDARPSMNRGKRRAVRRRVLATLLLTLSALVVATVVFFGGPRRIARRIETRLVQPTTAPAPADDRTERWRQDLDYLERNLVRLHADAFHATPRAAFEAEFAAARARIESASDAELLLEVMRLVSLVGDGHTATWAFLDAFGPLPLQVEPVGGVGSVTASSEEHAELLAGEVLVRADAVLLPTRDPQRAHWVLPLDGRDAVYLRYRSARDRDAFEAVAQEALALFDRSSTARLVVDLRGNGGGDSSVIRPLLDGVGERAAGSRVAALIDAGTYSSATMNARDLRELGAVLVGEPSGDALGGWGEVRTFTLPNSGIRVGVSSYFHGGDGARVAPDVPATPNVRAWLDGVDPVLEAALRR